MGRELTKDVMVSAGRDEVWDAWTTVDGVRTFFAPEAHIELQPGGPYEMYFDTGAPVGERGGEGCTVLEAERPARLAFTWNFPPSLPSIRHQHTRVDVRFVALGEGVTHVRLSKTGWQDGEDWEKGYQYFERAWSLVLGRLAYRFEEGPLDWSDPYDPLGG